MTQPTHILISNGAAVFPQGYDPAELEEIVDLENYWVEANKTTKRKAMRQLRDKLLDASDKEVMVDRPLTTEVRDLWYAYRQALRDIVFEDPETIEWPTPPAS